LLAELMSGCRNAAAARFAFRERQGQKINRR
jgi:hypothetical protein